MSNWNPKKKSWQKAGGHTAAGFSLSAFVWVSQRDQWCQSDQAQTPTEGGVRSGELFLPLTYCSSSVWKHTAAFHPKLCTQRNRKCLHHSLHPSSQAKRSVTLTDFCLALLSTPKITDSLTPLHENLCYVCYTRHFCCYWSWNSEIIFVKTS